MAQIILELCPRCLARLAAPAVVTEQDQLDRTLLGCEECAGLMREQADAMYSGRLAKARVWYTVPETYDNVLY